MAASLARGESEIRNIAVEPEVIDLINCLNKMGAKIELGENRNVHIQGVDQLQGAVHSIIPDRIENPITIPEVFGPDCKSLPYWIEPQLLLFL